MIDLSYLTEEEKGMVLAVLKRDAELKNLEEQRIKRLRKTEKDSSRLKYLTGEWFYETKYHRHRDRIHGSDIIRASMGQRKPYTISELSHRWDEKPSLVNSERRDVFIPPELMGLIEDPSTQSRNDRVDDQKFPEAQQERQRSQIKPRQNPFNIRRYADRHINGVKEAEQAPSEEPLLAAKSSTPFNAIQNTDNTETHVCTQCTGKPVPKNRLLLNSGTDYHLDITDGDPSVIQDASPAPRGIFKAHDCSSYSFTGSILDPSICPISLEIPISPPLSPCTMQSVSEWLDRKQVHVSPIVRPIESEKGEHSVLDEDWSPLVDEDKEPDRSDTMNNDNHELYAEPQCTQVSNFNSTAEVTGDNAEHSPVQAALERASTRPISISKSLEDLPSTPSSSTVASNTNTSFSDPEQIKMMSLSVPTFINQEMDYRNGDCASVSSLQFDRPRACNASPAFNICSEVTSMSSVTGSVTSINSGEFGNVAVKGTIQFAINYVEKLEDFHIFVVKCKDLAVADPKRNRSDPYVKCYLLPDKAKFGKRKTCVRKKTLDPTYNEILRYKIPMETLKTQKLNVSVWHNDTFGHNSCLGEVDIDLAEWDFSTTQMNEYLLKGRVQVPRSPKHSACSEEMIAEMRVALRFLQQTSHSPKTKMNGEVQILVKECRNLPISRGVSINPFVKCTVLPDTSRKSRQKTRVVKRSSNPEFNHTLVYEGFRPEDLKEACVELTVWDHERLHSHFIGGIRLGPGTGKSYGADVDWMDSSSDEAALWEKMMQSHNEWVEGVLPLRMLLMAKKSAST
ncbi:synaptotagmin-like protein 2 isoform X5 [Paramisgurnus dabryanus]|uniref:synaptotagmin-like protein 2 isoform X5 n=1 Tax=Paramisgurnus dabryanus TaxID=90735 RepID=UPI0031F3ED49